MLPAKDAMRFPCPAKERAFAEATSQKMESDDREDLISLLELSLIVEKELKHVPLVNDKELA